MVLSFQGVELNQKSIVERIKGEYSNTTANILEIFNLTNTLLKGDNGQEFVVSGQLLKGLPTPTVLYNYLKQQEPIIIIYDDSYRSKHAVVLTGIDVEVNYNCNNLQKIIIKGTDKLSASR